MELIVGVQIVDIYYFGEMILKKILRIAIAYSVEKNILPYLKNRGKNMEWFNNPISGQITEQMDTVVCIPVTFIIIFVVAMIMVFMFIYCYYFMGDYCGSHNKPKETTGVRMHESS